MTKREGMVISLTPSWLQEFEKEAGYMNRQEEIRDEGILLRLRECLDDADVPMDDRMLKIECPHCGEIITLGDKDDN